MSLPVGGSKTSMTKHSNIMSKKKKYLYPYLSGERWGRGPAPLEIEREHNIVTTIETYQDCRNSSNIQDKNDERSRFLTGFTLVELIVAIGVFISVLTIAVAVFIGALRAQRFLMRVIAVNNNAGIVMEQMAREMRTGYNFSGLSNSCASDISFSNSQNSNPLGGEAKTSYFLENGAIKRSESSNTSVLTSSNTEVENLCFQVLQYNYNKEGKQKCNPPRVLITMKVTAKGGGQNTESSYLETTVSSRVLPSEIKNDPDACRVQ